jgi:hypothetical protein
VLPQLGGKLVTCYPADDDATLFLFHTPMEKHGASFLDRYMATEQAFVQGHLGVLRWIAAGRRALTFDCSMHAGTRQSVTAQRLPVKKTDNG